jgi:glycosyltransferase involved in cell wall biosynthesis
MSNPKISVIVPVYKAEQFLKECVDSILNQTFRDFELILVDDCSPDNSPQMCDDYAKQDSRIKVIHNNPNQGSVKSYKNVVDASRGDYLVFFDSDDWIEVDSIERLYRHVTNDGCDVVYADLIRFDGKKLAHCKPFDTRGMGKEEIVISLIDDDFTQFLVCRLFKRSLFDKLVWPEYQYREDSIIVIQLFLNAEKVGYEYSLLYHYRYNLGSITMHRNYPKLKKEEYLNFKHLDDIMRARPDYIIYKKSLEAKLNEFKTYKKLYFSFNIAKFFTAFIPYGVVAAYRKFKGK